MKIQPRVYTFEVGDMIAAPSVDVVAIRMMNGTWKHTNLDYDDESMFADASAEYKLESCGWIYVGNRRELVKERTR